MDLIFRQGKCIGLGADDILNTKPIPSTTATLYSWGWMCKKKNWLEGLAAMTMTEWNQDDRLLGDLGGGHAFRMGSGGSSTWASRGTICRIGKRTARPTKAMSICFFLSGKNSAKAKTKK